MSKKILIISSIILIILTVSLGLYYFLLRSNNSVSQGNLPSFGDLFPFGSGPNDISPATTTDFQYDPLVGEQPDDFKKRLRLLSREPVAGQSFIKKVDLDYVRFIEKATGHIYDIGLTSNDKVRVSNTTIPQVFDAYFANNGNSLITRYLVDNNYLNTYFSNIVGTSTEKNLETVFLTEDIKDVSVSPEGKNIFYLENKNESSFGLIQTLPSINKKTVWNFRPSQLNIEMLNNKDVLVLTKPSTNENGFGYILDTNTGAMKNIFKNILGLTAKGDGVGNKILFYTTARDGRLLVYDVKKDFSSAITPTTFPEKCVFHPNPKKDSVYCAVSKNSTYSTSLISWYMGIESYSDDIWEYNLGSSTAEKIMDLENESGEEIDVYKPMIDKTGSNLIFVNKINGSLWNLNLEKDI